MITAEVHIREYAWELRIYLAVTCYYTDEIMDSLARIGCPPEIIAPFGHGRGPQFVSGSVFKLIRA